MIATTRKSGRYNQQQGSIPSLLKEYILIDSTAISVSAFYIHSTGHWELQEYKDIDSSLMIQTIQVGIPLKDIYEDSGLA
ncbi:hypothetical protein [Paraflavitalea pollutisoli]|uniref:hypothetical protein n=1 Tax=Paraflavitalea pollutisoli TaxID=3034143 RepID=UPI0023EC7043|nr:hypothetical protein [Paraflavitalea sp. H1-2-19X]